ncbi:hypothetical protein [Hahella sp. HN01]|uniref:hypothetical protein n=1 Tax=Hahella sp. HN01 TaxID=2847262 RepID=UPI001C1EB578|nr:hypothetical protein [Hahella sp. HN01]MBU6951024.1 hypothetical protein [Hahella sp. HN01]
MIKQLVRPLLTGKGPNFSKLTTKECGIGDYRLRYKLPGNIIKIGTADAQTPSRVNLQADLFESYSPKKLFNRTFVRMDFEWWAYRGIFLQGDSGLISKMSLHLDVNQAESHTPLFKEKLDSLESYLKKDYWEYYETEENKDGEPGANWQQRYNFENPDEVRAKGYIPLGRLELVTHLPEIYYREAINGLEWLHYCIRGEGVGRGQSYYWAYPLSDNYYLTLNFRVSSEIGNKELRYQRMYEDAKRIMSMVELRKE